MSTTNEAKCVSSLKTPGGKCSPQQSIRRLVSIAFQLASSTESLPVSAPSDAVEFSVAPAIDWRCGSRLSSSASLFSIWLNSSFGCGFLGLGSGFFCSFLSASAIGSLFCSVGFALGSGGVGVALVSVLISGLSTTFGAGSLVFCGSPILSTIGFGVSAFGAVREPAVMCEKSLRDTTSTITASSGIAGGGLKENHSKVEPRIRACPTVDIVAPSRTLRTLLHLGDQRDPMEARRRQAAHHAHHCAVVHLAIAAYINALVETAAACLGNGLQLDDEVVDTNLVVLQVDL